MAAKHSTTTTVPDADQVTQQASEAGVRLVRFLYTDNGGVTRGKSTPVQFLRRRIDDGIGLTKAMQAMNMLDQLAPVDGMGPVGEIRLVPDPATFRVLPYAPHAAAMTVDTTCCTRPVTNARSSGWANARTLTVSRPASTSLVILARRRGSRSSSGARPRPKARPENYP